MKISARLLFAAISPWTALAYGQSAQKEPHVGYVYPAGGRQGSTFQIIAGGQRLAGVKKVHVSGEGVTASFKYKARWTRLREQGQSALLRRLLNERHAALGIEIAELPHTQRSVVAGPERSKKKIASATETPVLPESELLKNIQNLNLKEIELVEKAYLTPRNKKADAQIGEMVLIDVVIAPNAAPGSRELRLETSAGLTNPLSFEVGMLPEIEERESKTPGTRAELTDDKSLDLPILINGQIMPGDIDKFRFNARRGQNLVITVHARSLIPYLADAVPGWFQAVLTLYDAKGNEAAFSDDYRFDPDPVLFYQIPKNGEYELEIRDSIYRGREDFVYRIAVSELPFITQIFPLGGKAGVETIASINGWNLPTTRLSLDTQHGEEEIRQTVFHKGNFLSNPVVYAVDALPECNETEPNDSIKDAQPIDLPKIINGRIDRPGDIDIFQFEGRAGDKVVAEVYSRRLNSPLDSLLRLTDASGSTLIWNDDYVIEDNHLYKDITGLVTHHADSFLMADLTKDGTYYLHLTDAQNHGGRDYGYRLRLSAPRPDFALRVTPSSLSVPAGGAVPICIHALRKDGFDGKIEIVLKDAPAGFELNGGLIPTGRDHIRMTLTAPSKAPDSPVVINLEGCACIGGKKVSHPIVPAEDMMQAFLYRHLVPSQELMVAVKKSRWPVPPAKLIDHSPVKIPVDGSVQVRINTTRRMVPQDIQLELNEPPDGITLHDVNVQPGEMTFLLKTNGDKVKTGFIDNLIVEAFTETVINRQADQTNSKKRRVSLGVLPAIPIEIVKR